MANVRDSLLQRITQSEALQALAPNWAQALITDYILKSEDINLIASSVDSITPQSGSGNPNTLQIRANASKIFYNTSTNPPEQWFNNTIGATSGWVQL